LPTLAVEIIQDVQKAEASTISELIVQEVH
jgi:hypothetical protein